MQLFLCATQQSMFYDTGKAVVNSVEEKPRDRSEQQQQNRSNINNKYILISSKLEIITITTKLQ